MYCSFCGIPVAKKSFATRHSHGIPVGRSRASAKKSAPTSEASNKRALGSTGMLHRTATAAKKPKLQVQIDTSKAGPPRPAADKKGTSESSHQDTSSGPSNQSSTTSSSGKKVSFGTSQPEESSSGSSETRNSSDEADTLLDTQEQWKRLLMDRPQSGSEEMSRWLMRVMAVSDTFQLNVKRLQKPKAPSSDDDIKPQERDADMESDRKAHV